MPAKSHRYTQNIYYDCYCNTYTQCELVHAFDSENILFLFHLQTCTCLVSSVLDSGGVVGNLFLIIGLPIIAVAVLAVFTVLVTIILLTYFYRRLVFIVVEHMSCLGYFHTQFVRPFTNHGLYLFSFTFRRRSRDKQKKVSIRSLVTYSVT